MRFNTAISAMMVFVNEAVTWDQRPASIFGTFLVLLHPFAPHLAEELWSKLKQSSAAGLTGVALSYQPWPRFDPQLLVEATLEMPVQVNGKVRGHIQIAATATEEEVKAAALGNENVKPFLEGKTIQKVIVVPKKLVNIAVA